MKFSLYFLRKSGASLLSGLLAACFPLKSLKDKAAYFVALALDHHQSLLSLKYFNVLFEAHMIGAEKYPFWVFSNNSFEKLWIFNLIGLIFRESLLHDLDV